MNCVNIFHLLIAVTSSLGAIQIPQAGYNTGLRIVGGENALIGQFPWTVSFQQYWNSEFEHICGATVINEEWLVSAAHCITNYEGQGEFRIVAGVVNLNDSNAQISSVRDSIIHPDFGNSVGPNDISLIRLTTPLIFDETVRSIALPEPDSTVEGEALLSGWGYTEHVYPDILQRVTLPILEYDECKNITDERLGDTNTLNETSNICTGPLYQGHAAACSADSGSPLIQFDDDGIAIFIGIVSWGFLPCSGENSPSVYTRVSSFVEFILRNTLRND